MRLFTTITFLILNSLIALSQQYEITNFSKGEYLGKSDFYDFCQDSSLSIYFGTNSGLLKYDGDSFINIIDSDSLLTGKRISQLLYLNGEIFFASETGLFKYNLKTNIVSTIYNKAVKQIRVIEGKLYFSTANGLYQCNKANQNLEITELFRDESILIKTWLKYDNQFFLGTENGLVILDEKFQPTKKGSYLNITEIKKNSDESLLLLGSLQQNKWGLFKYALGDIIKIIDLPNNNYTDLYLSNLANIIISDKKGHLYIFDGLNLRELDYNNEVLKFAINQLKEDNEKNLWALGKQGLMYIKVNSPINQYVKKGVIDFSSAKDEQIYFTKNSITITDTYGQESKIIVSEEFNDEKIHPFNLDNNWYFNKNKKLFKIANKKIELIKLKGNLKEVIKSGNSLIGIGDSSVYLLDKDFIISDTLLLSFNYEDIIIGLSGIILINKHAYVKINEQGVFKERLSTVHASSNTVYLDENNHVWTYTDSIIHNVTNGKSLSIPGLYYQDNLKIYNIYNDNNRHLWLSTNDAILKIKIEESAANYLLSDIVAYDKSDYFLNTYFKKVIPNNNDLLYFIHENGISTFNSLLNNANLVPPGLKINKATAYSIDNYNQVTDTINLLTDSNTHISRKNRIVISASPINFNRENRSVLYYRDKINDQEWTQVKNGDDIYLNDITSGKHTLEFKSANIDGVESDYKLVITLSVEEPFWTQYWFVGALILIMLIIIYLVYKSINNFKDGKTKELHERLDKELADLEKRSHLQILKAERLKQLNELITSQKSELEKKNTQIESQKYELSLTNQQIKEQKDLLEETSSKLKASINYAQRIQDALMSTEVEIKEAIDESFVYFQPRDVVSGDFYWFNNVVDENGHQIMILAAVDCTGHGVPGAIVSVVGMNLLNNITNLKKIYDPGKILYELNKDIIHNLRQSETQVNDGMDMSIVAINTTTKELKFAGAKNPLIYIENNELIRIRGDKNAIGGQQREQKREYITHSIPPSNGQKRTYYLFSDGYQDQFGGVKGFKFLTSNFKELLLSIHNKPVIDQKEILYNTINEWKGDYHQTDDMLVIGFKF